MIVCLPCQMMGFVGCTLNFLSRTYSVWMQWSFWTIPHEHVTLSPIETCIIKCLLWTYSHCHLWRWRKLGLFREQDKVCISWRLVTSAWLTAWVCFSMELSETCDYYITIFPKRYSFLKKKSIKKWIIIDCSYHFLYQGLHPPLFTPKMCLNHRDSFMCLLQLTRWNIV